MQPSFSKTQHTGDNVLSWLCSWALQPDQPDLVLGSATCQMNISLYHSQKFIKPQFPYLLSRNNNCIYFRGSYWTLNRLMQRKLTCWQRVTEQRTANLFWEWRSPRWQPERQWNLSPTTPRNWILPTTLQTWKGTLNSGKETTWHLDWSIVGPWEGPAKPCLDHWLMEIARYWLCGFKLLSLRKFMMW